jgi:hypothetical protein
MPQIFEESSPVSGDGVTTDVVSPQQVVARAMSMHATWRNRLTDAIEHGTCDISVEDAGADDVCPFGHWLARDIPVRLRKTWDYATVKKRHTELHVQLGQILDLALLGRQQSARDLMLPGSPFAAAFDHFEEALKEWYPRVESQAAGNAF